MSHTITSTTRVKELKRVHITTSLAQTEIPVPVPRLVPLHSPFRTTIETSHRSSELMMKSSVVSSIDIISQQRAELNVLGEEKILTTCVSPAALAPVISFPHPRQWCPGQVPLLSWVHFPTGLLPHEHYYTDGHLGYMVETPYWYPSPVGRGLSGMSVPVAFGRNTLRAYAFTHTHFRLVFLYLILH